MQAVLMRPVALAALALTAGIASAQPKLMRLPGGVPGFTASTVKIAPVLSPVLRSAGLDQPMLAYERDEVGAGHLTATMPQEPRRGAD